MNIDSFIERWNRISLNKRLIMMLVAILRHQKVAELSIPMDEIDEVQNGESVLVYFSGKDIVVKHIPEQVQLLTIQEASPWTAGTTSQTPADQAKMKAVLTDEELAKREQSAATLRTLADRAKSMRNRSTLETMTDDLGPLPPKM